MMNYCVPYADTAVIAVASLLPARQIDALSEPA